MDEPEGAAVARPKIQWGEAAVAQSNEQDAEPAPVGDSLSEAAATLKEERQKHEKRCAVGTLEAQELYIFASRVCIMALHCPPARLRP